MPADPDRAKPGTAVRDGFWAEYAEHARDLRADAPDAGDAVAIMVSEFMLNRPRSSGYAARAGVVAAVADACVAGRASPGTRCELGRLGYPRRALRLHQSAQ